VKAPDPRLGEIEARAKEAEPLCVSSCPSELCRAEIDRAYLLTELRKRDGVIAAVEALHRPIQKWEPYDGAGYTFATREEALRAAGEEDLNSVAMEAGPQPFEVCLECSRVESEQLVEIGEEWGYRESLWPCPTVRAVTAAKGDGE